MSSTPVHLAWLVSLVSLLPGALTAETTFSTTLAAGQRPTHEPHRVLGVWTAATPTELFGFKVRDLGDVDGDGVRDFVAGANRRDNGSIERAGAVEVFSTATGKLLSRYAGRSARGSFGNALGLAGDVDGDGVPDLYAGDFADELHDADGSGRVLVVSGRNGEVLWNLEGPADFGTGYGRVGDVDGDGHADVLVGNWISGEGAPAGGAARLYSGADGRLLDRYTGRLPGRTFGHDAIGIGDVDGDGAIDLLITNAGNSAEDALATGHVYLLAGPGPSGR